MITSNIAKNHPELKQGILWGEYFPKHLQVAYGRAVFRLMNKAGDTHGLKYLRDLPLNLWDLNDLGYYWALRAYNREFDRALNVCTVTVR